MSVSPLRQFDPQLIQDPLVYRLYEVIGPPVKVAQTLCNSSKVLVKLICLLTHYTDLKLFWSGCCSGECSLRTRVICDIYRWVGIYPQPDLGVQAVMHYGESIKAIGNEVKLLPTHCPPCLPNAEGLGHSNACSPALRHQIIHRDTAARVSAWSRPLEGLPAAAQEFGDGIMSAIDMFASIDDVEGKLGEKRLVLTLNGKVAYSF